MAEQKPAPGLDARLERLEQIVAALDREELELDQALALFEEGIAQLRAAEEILRHTELRVRRMLEDPGGEIVLEPMSREPE
ncbi:MAG: exodeoxyribonuclease VII small subunit [Gemmatimonadetes bacterium]|nr:exodeoxyribonuclease VII small subunit [Gemmatimonadota bacterium]